MRYASVIFLFALAFLLSRCGNNNQGESDGLVYTCPMHPEVVSDKPGICPVCEMALVMKRDDENELTPLLRRADEYIVANAATISPVWKSLPVSLSLTGMISYDPREEGTISARAEGRIEKLHVRYRFQPIEKGQPLFDIYSPGLITAQEELIYLLENDPGNTPLIGAAEKKLLLLGFTQKQVSAVKSTRQHIHSVTVYSEQAGHLHEPSAAMDEFPGEAMSAGTTGGLTELSLKEGAYVQAGQAILSVYSTGRVWALLQVHPAQQNLVRPGQKVSLEVDGAPVEATVDFIEPFAGGRTTFATVRCYLDNAGGLIRIGAPVKAHVHGEEVEGLFIPAKAVVHLGRRDVVYEQQGNAFRATEIESGYRDAGWVQVTYGLDTSSVIAASAQFLSDSESFIMSEE